MLWILRRLAATARPELFCMHVASRPFTKRPDTAILVAMEV
jgi:hypothetical protein